MKRLLLLIFLTFMGNIGFAQRETDNWFFGDHASLEFNTNGVPVSWNVSAMDAPAGCASISDQFGNLLFYTNGEKIWNRLHQLMANGTGLAGGINATQSSIIVPKPGSNSGYYIFLKPEIPGTNNLYYCEVDMLANNGLGEIIASTKNTPLGGVNTTNNTYDKITAVHHANNRDIWVITIIPSTSAQCAFVAYKVTPAGLDPNPVTSILATPFVNGAGILKASPDGKHLATTFYNGFLLDFNNKTGIVSSPRQITGAFQYYYGVEFSPDGTKLYLANGNEIAQYNITLGSGSAIAASKVVVYSAASLPNLVLQLASNGKVYAGKQGFNNLSVINNPNAVGMACNFQAGPNLASLTFSRLGLPNFIQSYFAPPKFNFTGICQGSPITFTLSSQAGLDSVKWNFGEPLSGIKNFSKAWQPSHIYTFSGFYNVTLTTFSNGDSAVYSRQITLKNKPQVHLGKDTILCKGRTLVLRNAFPASPFNERYRWNTKDTTATINVTQPGIYWLELSNGSCTFRDSVKVTFVDAPKVELGPSNTYCGGTPVTLDAGNALPGTTYLWRPGNQTTQTINVTQTGQYAVTVTRNGCVSTDFVNVTFNSTINLNLGPDREACEEDGEITLKGPGPFTNPAATYLWNNGTTETSLKINKSGKYWLQVKRGVCTETDTVTISYKACPPPPVPIIPNIITPNNDQVNDQFEIKNIPVGEWKLKIFNRWGSLLFETDKYFNNWPQKDLNDGVYYYLLEDTSTNRKFKGWLECVH